MRLLRIIRLTLGIGAGLYLLFILYLVVSPDLTNYFSRIYFSLRKMETMGRNGGYDDFALGYGLQPSRQT